jgi:hypothetical protein
MHIAIVYSAHRPIMHVIEDAFKGELTEQRARVVPKDGLWRNTEVPA